MERSFRELLELAKSIVDSEYDGTEKHTTYMDKISTIEHKFTSEYLKRPTGEDAGQYMENFVNSFSMRKDSEQFVRKAVHGTHRTLNQSLIGLFFQTILEEATLAETGRYDLRNEASVKACAKLAPIIKDTYLPFI